MFDVFGMFVFSGELCYDSEKLAEALIAWRDVGLIVCIDIPEQLRKSIVPRTIRSTVV